MKIKKIILSFMVLSFMVSSCEKDFLETAPTDALSAGVMFDSYAGAQLALNGMYAKMFYYGTQGGRLGHHGAGYFGNVLDIDLMGEDMARWDRGYGWYTATYGWISHRTPDGGVNGGRWSFFYELINNANIILFYADEIDDATAGEIANVKAQALVMRALCYHWVVQKHAKPYHTGVDNPGVPIYTEPTQEGHPRASVGEVYDRITQDLEDAITYFNATADPMAQRHISHSTLAVAYGLQARVALTMHDFGTAISAADNAIANAPGSLFTPADFASNPDQLFNNASASEWFWGFVINEEQTPYYASFISHMDARYMSYASLGGQVMLNHELYDAMTPTDVRRGLWVSPEEAVEGDDYLMAYNNKKFLATDISAPMASDLHVMRLAEMYLIKAEAAARSGDDGTAQSALNDLVSNRDPAFDGTTNTGDALIEEIMFHRRIELWGEGFRYFDLKRTDTPLRRTAAQGHAMGLANIHNVDPGDPRWEWYIPQDEIDANDAISGGDQNP